MTALDDFVASRIGGEELVDTGDGRLISDTAVQAVAVIGELVDSPSVTSRRVRLLTRLLRGAALTLYALVHTLGGEGLRRGLGLLLLAVGGSFLAVDLLTGSTPEWLSTAGFGVLLGGLAYAAIAARMLVHALLLATPVVPLVAYALNRVPEAEPAGASGSVIVVVGLVATVLLVGSARDRRQTPWVWLRHQRGWASLLQLAALVAVAVALYLQRGEEAPDWLPAALVVGLAAVAAAGVGATAGLRYRVSRSRAGSVRDTAQARYVAGTWACCYGAAYAGGTAAVVAAGTAAEWAGPVTYSLAGLALACFAVPAVLAVRRPG